MGIKKRTCFHLLRQSSAVANLLNEFEMQFKHGWSSASSCEARCREQGAALLGHGRLLAHQAKDLIDLRYGVGEPDVYAVI